MGSQQPYDGLFNPMEVQTNHLPMCTGPSGTCLSGMVLHIENFALHGLISHRDHSNVNHISSLVLLNICMKNLIYHSKAQGRYKILQCKPEVNKQDNLLGFIIGLPKVQGKDCIYVVVDRLTKFAHSYAIPTEYNIVPVVKLFFKEVFRLHGLPRNIISDRDSRFMGTFWRELFQLVGT
jgi:hypothetical protein